MTQARRIDTNETLEGVELKILAERFGEKYVDDLQVVCTSQGCQAIPQKGAYRKEHKIASFFRYKIAEHADSCTIYQNKNTRQKRSKKNDPISRKFNSPNATYIYKLRFDTHIPQIASPELGSQCSNQYTNISQSDNQRSHAEITDWMKKSYAKSIRPIVKWFLLNPSKGYLPLIIEGYYARTYKETFKFLDRYNNEHYHDYHIYYGELYWTKLDHKQENILSLGTISTLPIFYWEKSNRKFILNIDTTHWEPGEVGVLNHELRASIDAIKAGRKGNAQQSNKKNHTKLKLWVFFWGRPYTSKTDIFYVNDPRLIYIHYGKNPTFLKRFFQKKYTAKPLNPTKENKWPNHSKTATKIKPILHTHADEKKTHHEEKQHTTRQKTRIMPLSLFKKSVKRLRELLFRKKAP